MLYYNWARTVLQEVVTTQALAQVRGHLGDMKHMLAAGLASPADVMRIESQAASAELLVERTHNLARVMGEQLAISMAEPEASAWQIGEDLRAVLSGLPEVGADPAKLVTEALENRLEPHVLDENRKAIIEQSKVVRAGQYPRLDVFGNVNYANPNQRIFPQQDEFKFTWDVGVGLSWSPNDLGIARASARVIDSQVSQLEQQKRNLIYGLTRRGGGGVVGDARSEGGDGDHGARTGRVRGVVPGAAGAVEGGARDGRRAHRRRDRSHAGAARGGQRRHRPARGGREADPRAGSRQSATGWPGRRINKTYRTFDKLSRDPRYRAWAPRTICSRSWRAGPLSTSR